MSDSPGPPFHGLTWDDDLEKRADIALMLARGQARVERWLDDNASSRLLTLELVLAFHQAMFDGVFPDLAGRLRGPEPLGVPLDVDFGNYLGTPHLRVPGECEQLFRRVSGFLAQLDELVTTDQAALHEESLKAAAYLRCEMVRIHPFANGNGRTARVCPNYVALRYGKRLVPFDRPRGEYIEAVRTWLQLRVIEHFIDHVRPMWLDSD